MKKRFGQNFLINDQISNKIVELGNINDQNIIEIGPGNLALTNAIKHQKPKKFISIEIDNSLKKNYSQTDLQNIIFEDALNVDERKYFNNENFTIISNLPFNISSQLLTKWIFIQNNYNCINEMILMFQKELAERIVAKVNTKKYGRLTILCKGFFDVEYCLSVLKDSFFPKPKVDAAVLRFKKLKENKIDKNNFKKLEKITSLFFNERRKKNKKKFEKILNQNKINNFEKYFQLRAENLSEEIYFKLSKIIELKNF